MTKFKLHIRITILIAALSILSITLFTFIQLRNHLEKLDSFNKQRARVGAIIVKTTLEMLTKDIRLQDALPPVFEAAVESFSREGVADKVSIIAIDGTVLASSDPIIKEFGEARQDIEAYIRLTDAAGEKMWFYSAINERARSIDIYVPISISPDLKYIAKLSFSTANIKKAIRDILFPIIVTIIGVISGNLFLAFILLKTVVHPIETLNAATKEIASGNLDLKVRISTKDEIEELGETFNDMTTALKKMKERAENANPLTKLPGNNVIREEVEHRIKNNKKFVAIHIDLDNFKAYNDKYGIGKGDDVIKFTSRVLEEAIKSKGSASDFLGHEGGDDFFLITEPDTAGAVADAIISQFDLQIKRFYSKDDVATGYILEKNRQGELVKFPIMSISLAGVTNTNRTISSYAELTNIAVEVKKKAKDVQRSNFLLDTRRG